MKKYLVSAAFVLLVGGLVAGCDKEAKEEGKTVLPDPEVTAVSEIPGIPFHGTEFELKFTSSRNWMVTDATVDGSYDYDFKYSPIAGDAGKSTIKLTFPKNHTQEELEVTLTIALLDETSSTEGAYKHTFPTFTVPAPSVTDAAGNSYKVVLLKDDNYWMAENLRYVPEGKTVSDDATKPTQGIYYPVNKAEKKLDKDLVAQYGLLYQPSAAFGVELNKDNYKEVEGCQGICPEGWHIPTAKDYIALVGKINTNETLGYDVNENAPYYDAETKFGSITKLNEDGLNIDQNSGYLNAGNSSATSLTIINSMGWILGSSWHIGFNKDGVQASPTFGEDGSLTKVQYYSLMIYYNKADINTGTINSHLCAVPVRCVMDKTDE